MPSAITQGNRVAPWLGIGVQGQWDNSAEALHAAAMDFDVRQEELFWWREDQGAVYAEKAPMFANVRDDDDRLLGCVTPQYKIIQNRDAFSLIDPFLGTKYPCQIIMTPIRIYCQNMYRKLVNDRIFLAKHTTAADGRLQAIAQGNAVEKKVLAFSNIIDTYQGKHMSARQLEALIAMLFPYPKEGGPREVTYRLKADEARQRFKDVYFDAPDNRKHQDTAFGFVNAYFDYLSHRPSTRNSNVAWADRRLSGMVSGLDIDTKALHEALK